MLFNLFTGYYNKIIDVLGWTFLHSLWQFTILFLIAYYFKSAKTNWTSAKKYWANNILLWLAPFISIVTFLYYIVDNHTINRTIFLQNNPNLFIKPTEINESIGLFDQINQYLPILVYIWVIGAIIYFIHLLFGLRYISQLKKSSFEIIEDSILEIFNTLKIKLNIAKPITLLESYHIDSPILIGYFKPIILLPIGIINQLSIKELEAILAHEIAHFKRNDYLMNIIQLIIESIFYFHPAIWWISNRIRVERENCCDDIALSVCENQIIYAKSLYNLLKLKTEKQPSLALALKGSKNQELLLRIKRILNHSQNRSSMLEKISVTGLLMAAGILLSISANLPQKHITNSVDNQSNSDFVQDTTPKKIQKMIEKSIIDDGEKKIEITKENDNIKELILDGKTIAPEDYNKYEKEINMVIAPPPPPSSIPSPPPPPSMKGLKSPPLPPTPPSTQNEEIIIINSDDGKTKRIEKRVESKRYKEGNKQEKSIQYDIDMREHEKDMKRHEADMKEHDRAMKQHEADMKEHDKAMKQHEADMKEHEKDMANFEKEQILTKSIEQELTIDGFLKKSKDFSFDLSNDQLMINGEKQSDKTLKKYKKIYEKNSGKSLNKEDHIKIQMKSE